MLGLRQSSCVGVLLCSLLLSDSGWAQSPFRNLLPGSKPQDQTTEAAPASPRLFSRLASPFRRVNHEEAEKGYHVEMTDGPWLIMCASFLGEGRHQADALCKELRSMGFKAFLYEHSFDYSGEIQGLGYSVARSEGLVEQFDLAPAKMRAANPVRFDDVSVLVGHFSSAEDPKAEKTLEEIKRLFPKSLHVSETSSSFQRMSGYRQWVRSVSSEEGKKLGPMRGAFVVPNPLLPEDFFERQVVDPIVVKMNKGNKYSLLDNPKNYTVKVATFNGDTIYDQAEIEKKTREYDALLRSGKGLTESKLMEAEANANYLADLLRKEGFEAYAYHDRDSSIVCVGSFDWVVKNADSSNPTLNPASQDVVDKFKAKVVDNIPGVAPFYQPRTVKGPTNKQISFDLIPVAVAVPRIK